MMKKLLITGSNGFIGRNLTIALSRYPAYDVQCFDIDDDPASLETLVAGADFIFHLAGVNRPENPEEFDRVNVGLTRRIIEILERSAKNTPLLLSSSMQAELDNPYGLSKRNAEDTVFGYGSKTGAPVFVYRLPGVFGKWSRPNYNSVIATFCHNITHDLPISIDDPQKKISLVYIDDVTAHFISDLTGPLSGFRKEFRTIARVFEVTLGEVADMLRSFHAMRESLILPDLSNTFTRFLHATFLSYYDGKRFSYGLQEKKDDRGMLCELIKSNHFGQIFFSRTREGITRGNHYHDTKVEKFCVLQGKALIKLRNILQGDVIEYSVSGDRIEMVDIPPGYTHSIENTGNEELLVLFWASEIFNTQKPDTYMEPV
ncbi:MAG: NAD-dependent epimerase/dehydratase family protein [Vulcanimicrobiota bacterium]